MSPSTSNVYRTEYLRLRNTEIVSFCSIRTLLCIESKAIEYLKSTLFPSSKKQSQIRSKVYKIVLVETSFLATNRLNIYKYTSKGTASMNIDKNQFNVIEDKSMSSNSKCLFRSGSLCLTISLRHSWSACAPTRPESK